MKDRRTNQEFNMTWTLQKSLDAAAVTTAVVSTSTPAFSGDYDQARALARDRNDPQARMVADDPGRSGMDEACERGWNTRPPMPSSRTWPEVRTRIARMGLAAMLSGVGLPAAGQPVPEGGGSAQLAVKMTITLSGAQQVAAAAQAIAVRSGFRQSIVVLDDGGNLVVFYRMDAAQLAGFEVAMAKARTALFFQTTSKSFADRVLAGQVNVLGLPGAAPIDGGVPLMHDGHLVGAVGVSGASPAQDGQTATEAATALK